MVLDEINHPFPNFNGVTLEFGEWISNFIPHHVSKFGPQFAMLRSSWPMHGGWLENSRNLHEQNRVATRIGFNCVITPKWFKTDGFPFFLQRRRCGCCYTWHPSRTKKMPWFCSSVPSKTLRLSSSPSRTKMDEVRDITRYNTSPCHRPAFNSIQPCWFLQWTSEYIVASDVSNAFL